jgi:hypothetical protein
MVTLRRKLVAAAFFTLLFAVLVGLVIFGAFVVKPYTRPGEGYIDPAYAIHINPDGEVTDANANSSSVNIHRDGNIYTLTGNVTNKLILEKSNVVFDGGGFWFYGPYGLELSRISNVTIKNLNFNTHYGQIWLNQAHDCVIQNVTSSDRILLSHADSNTVVNCTGKIEFDSSNGNTVKNCTTGEVILSQSNRNSLIYNSISAQGPSLGIWGSSNNLIFGNNFLKFWWWISMTQNSTGNRIIANNVSASQLYQADTLTGTNYIYHNNFYNFKWNQTATDNSANVWSSGGRGNYWGQSGVDANHDGVIDSPHVIDKNNVDSYPLMSPVDVGSEPFPK